MKDALATRTSGTLAVVPDYLKGAIGTNDAEHEVGQEDLLIPRLAVAQDGMSPQLKKHNELYIEGLEPGDLFNTVTRDVYGTSVTVIPLFFTKNYVEFEGGGSLKVVNVYKSREEVPAEGLVWGNEGDKRVPPRITEFKNRMCLIEYRGVYQPIIVSFKKGEVKFSDQWNSQIKFARLADKLPCFAHTYTLASKMKTEGSKSWFVKTVNPLGFAPQGLYEQAKNYFDMLHQGGYSVDTTGIENDTKESDGDDPSFDMPVNV